jgi:hypothetical protein
MDQSGDAAATLFGSTLIDRSASADSDRPRIVTAAQSVFSGA